MTHVDTLTFNMNTSFMGHMFIHIQKYVCIYIYIYIYLFIHIQMYVLLYVYTRDKAACTFPKFAK